MTDLLIKEDDTTKDYKINKNELGDKMELSTIEHYLGINFPPIPFLWHYEDFAQPFPVYGCKKISIYKLKQLVKNNLLADLNDKNCDVYILAQYKKEKIMYSETADSSELYLSYHTWLYNNLTKQTKINNDKLNLKFRFLTGIYSIQGNLQQSGNYPFKKSKNPNKKPSPGGISVNNSNLEMRQATIHQHDGIIKFSGINVCNFNQTSDNSVFLSILKYPNLYFKNEKHKIETIKKKSNCVVLHIFRNVYDNNPNDPEYQELINKYMS